jgi:hypothetical protein
VFSQKEYAYKELNIFRQTMPSSLRYSTCLHTIYSLSYYIYYYWRDTIKSFNLIINFRFDKGRERVLKCNMLSM